MNPTARGIRRFTRTDSAAKPYCVQWRVDGKVKTESFSDEASRDKRADDLAKARRKGELVRMPSREELADWAAFRTAVGDVPWQDVVTGWKAHQQAAGLSPCVLSVEEAVATFLPEQKALMDAKRLGEDTYRQKKQKLEAFQVAFAGRRLSDVTGEEIAEWIEDELGFKTPTTFNSYRKHVRTLFERFRKQLRSNPCDDVKVREDVVDHVGILTPQETARLFAYALDNGHKDLLGRLALEFFAGLRFASAKRVEKADINFADKGILLPAHKLKTKRRHYIDALPTQLWDWLAVADEAGWAMPPIDYMHAKSKLFACAQVPHPHNCARHSFCTYDIAANKNPGLTATRLCHRNQGMLWARYNGQATQAAGKLYQEITPATCRSIAALTPVPEPAQQAG